MTSQTLLTAILSMDAYFRADDGDVDQDAGLRISSNVHNVGGAQVTDSVLDVVDGFGATYYELGSQKIISYRGTDFSGGNLPLAEDVISGWISGLGVLGPQAAAAILAYQNWSQHDLEDGPTDVILTGHSLGAGLAGFIASLTGNQAYIFDNMPYSVVSAAMSLFQFMPLDGSHITAVATEGEALTYARLIESVSAALYGPLAPAVLAGALQLQGEENRLADLGTHGWVPDTLHLQPHSMGLLALLQYAKDKGNTDWYAAGKPVIDALFSDEIGLALGFEKFVTGRYESSDQMKSALAYSALDGTTGLVYGNSGAHALFDDVDDIGAHYSSSSDAEFAKPIAEISTQFAGSLAKHKVTDVDVLGGVVKLHNDTNTLVVDLGENRWTEGGGIPDKIVGQENLVSTALGLSDGALTTAPPLADIMSALWGTNSYKLIKGVEIDTTDTGNTIQVAAGNTLPNGQQTVNLYVAGGGNDNITGSTQNDFVSGGSGNDQLTGNGAGTCLEVEPVMTPFYLATEWPLSEEV